MQQRIYTGYRPQILELTVQAAGAQNVFLTVQDSDKPKTILLRRSDQISDNHTFIIPMPMCGNKVDVTLVNENGTDEGLQYVGYAKKPLVTRPGIIDFRTFHLDEFMTFIMKFAYNFNYLKVQDPFNNEYYTSGFKHFFIKLLPYISNYDNGALEDTPTRICINTRLIEVSAQHCAEYTFPQLVALLLHEYAHGYANQNPRLEGEADINSVIIYWAYGFPKIELGNVWLNVFKNTPSDQNMNRMEDIVQFVENIENIFGVK